MGLPLFEGVYTALITPFYEGKIDYDSLDGLLKRQVDAGVHGLVICGTTGEAPTLRREERIALITYVLEKVRGRMKVVVGTGTHATESTLRLCKEAETIGVDGCMVVVPYYNRPTQKGLEAHFKRILEETSLGVIIYNIPSRTGTLMQVESFEALLSYEGLRGMKDAVGDVSYTTDFLARYQDRYLVSSGNDDLNYPILSLGGKGVISVVSNVLPQSVVRMYERAKEGLWEDARQEHYSLWEMSNFLFVETNPIIVKALMHRCGWLRSAELRLPLVGMQPRHLEGLESIQKRYHLLRGDVR